MLLESVILVLTCSEVYSARILGVFPIPSISHQVVFRAYMHELAKHGHEVVIITPNPALPKDRPPDNITEIDVGFSYEFVEERLNKLDIFDRGVIATVKTVTKELYDPFLYAALEQIKSPEVQKLIENKVHFDLIVVEAYFGLQLVYGHIFKAPVIQFSSFHGLPENYETVGGLSSHLLFYPNFNRNKYRDLSFCDKIEQMYWELKLRYEFWRVKQEGYKIVEELLGPKAPTMDELKENVQMLFVNTHALFEDNRPVPPNVIYLGALHLQPLKEIPKDLKEYLDSSKRGVVYVSLGSNVLPSKMDKDFLDTFLDAFAILPYDILWKFEGDSIERLPDNVKTQKWFPQRDMLIHPNIKAFVTQGGLQSTDEAIDAMVPLVGIPMLGDQWYNVNKYVEQGIGVQLDCMTVTAEQLANAVKAVIEDGKYKRNIQRLSLLMKDQPQTPLERAIWWTEHVLRHGNGRHLRAPTANVSWIEYYILDLVIPLILVLVFISYLLCKIIGLLFSVLWKSRKDVKIKKT